MFGKKKLKTTFNKLLGWLDKNIPILFFCDWQAYIVFDTIFSNKKMLIMLFYVRLYMHSFFFFFEWSLSLTQAQHYQRNILTSKQAQRRGFKKANKANIICKKANTIPLLCGVPKIWFSSQTYQKNWKTCSISLFGDDKKFCTFFFFF